MQITRLRAEFSHYNLSIIDFISDSTNNFIWIPFELVIMSSESNEQSGQIPVTTYVPPHQKDEWQNESEELGIALSDYVRQMVQAGRREIFENHRRSDGEQNSNPKPDIDADLEEEILEILSGSGFHPWEDLLESLTGNIEERLETALEDLQQENLIRYSGKNGGYTLSRK